MIRRILTYVLAGLALWGAKTAIHSWLQGSQPEVHHGPAHTTLDH